MTASRTLRRHRHTCPALGLRSTVFIFGCLPVKTTNEKGPYTYLHYVYITYTKYDRKILFLGGYVHMAIFNVYTLSTRSTRTSALRRSGDAWRATIQRLVHMLLDHPIYVPVLDDGSSRSVNTSTPPRSRGVLSGGGVQRSMHVGCHLPSQDLRVLDGTPDDGADIELVHARVQFERCCRKKNCSLPMGVRCRSRLLHQRSLRVRSRL